MREIDPEQEIYPIGVVSKLTGLPQRYLRALEERGVLKPARSEKNRRLYSENEVKKLQDIYYLAVLRKVNIAGIKEILRIFDALSAREREKVRELLDIKMLQAEGLKQRPAEVLPADLEEVSEISDEIPSSSELSGAQSPGAIL
ncbi:MAG: MerR family transcriptional regulator, partial [Nitrospinota bacterium]